MVEELVGARRALVQDPLRLSDADSCTWDAAADVVVVGFGAAGAAAAIQTVQRGGTALVVERFLGGGATALSGGIIYAGGGTRQQLDTGVRDDPENMFRYLAMEAEGSVSDECLRDFCNGSVEMMTWLEDLGLEFEATLAPAKTSYPAQPYFLYYSGNEALPCSAEGARPAPRGHRHVARGQAGRAFYARLKSAAMRAGVGTLLQARVPRLVIDARDGVIGVEAVHLPPHHFTTHLHALICRLCGGARTSGPALFGLFKPLLTRIEGGVVERKLIRARRGVVLATGGYICNRAMFEHYLPQYVAGQANGALGCDGSGILLGTSVGGATKMMDHASAWRFINPPSAFAKGVMVNARGERFCDESAYGARIGRELLRQPGGKAWLIIDQKLFTQARYESMPTRAWLFQCAQALLSMYLMRKRAPTIEALAAACGLDPRALSSTIDTYNRIVRGEQQDPVRKSPEFLAALVDGPFYALDVSTDSKAFPLAVISFGGLDVNDQTSQVRRGDGSLIDGLYAVGRTAAGIPSNNYMSGLAIADCIFTGRRAATAAMTDQRHGSRPGTTSGGVYVTSQDLPEARCDDPRPGLVSGG